MNNSLPVEVLEAEVDCLRKEYKLALDEIKKLNERIMFLEGKIRHQEGDEDDKHIYPQKRTKRTQRGKFKTS